MKDKQKKIKDELRPEYNFDYSKAVRGKYYKRLLEEGTNVVVLDPDVAKTFHDSASVNEGAGVGPRYVIDIANKMS